MAVGNIEELISGQFTMSAHPALFERGGEGSQKRGIIIPVYNWQFEIHIQNTRKKQIKNLKTPKLWMESRGQEKKVKYKYLIPRK